MNNIVYFLCEALVLVIIRFTKLRFNASAKERKPRHGNLMFFKGGGGW